MFFEYLGLAFASIITNECVVEKINFPEKGYLVSSDTSTNFYNGFNFDIPESCDSVTYKYGQDKDFNRYTNLKLYP